MCQRKRPLQQGATQALTACLSARKHVELQLHVNHDNLLNQRMDAPAFSTVVHKNTASNMRQHAIRSVAQVHSVTSERLQLAAVVSQYQARPRWGTAPHACSAMPHSMALLTCASAVHSIACRRNHTYSITAPSFDLEPTRNAQLCSDKQISCMKNRALQKCHDHEGLCTAGALNAAEHICALSSPRCHTGTGE